MFVFLSIIIYVKRSGSIGRRQRQMKSLVSLDSYWQCPSCRIWDADELLLLFGGSILHVTHQSAAACVMDVVNTLAPCTGVCLISVSRCTVSCPRVSGVDHLYCPPAVSYSPVTPSSPELLQLMPYNYAMILR